MDGIRATGQTSVTTGLWLRVRAALVAPYGPAFCTALSGEHSGPTASSLSSHERALLLLAFRQRSAHGKLVSFRG
jgi:hypothetical protein